MKRQYFFLFPFSFLLLASFAGPTVTSFSQDAETLKVTVNYTLDAPAIVTADFQTKVGGQFVSIGDDKFTQLAGDVNRYIETTGNHTFFWQPDASERERPSVSAADFQVVLNAWRLDEPPLYMAVNLATSNSVFYYTSAAAVPGGVTNNLYKTDFLLMRHIPAKGVTWKMGSPDTDALADPDAEMLHEVTLTEDYWMAVYEFTQAQYSQFYSGRGNSFTDFPESLIIPVSACAYYSVRGDLGQANWPSQEHKVGGCLAQMRKRTGVEFDLPTEAQWEYACRAGTATQWHFAELSASTQAKADELLKNYAYMSYNNYPCSPTQPSCGPVGNHPPNDFGLYDMHGNVREWCLDYWQASLGDAPVTDPKGPASSAGSARVARGGGYTTSAHLCRSAARMSSTELSGANSYFGFRVMAPIALKW